MKRKVGIENMPNIETEQVGTVVSTAEAPVMVYKHEFVLELGRLEQALVEGKAELEALEYRTNRVRQQLNDAPYHPDYAPGGARFGQ